MGLGARLTERVGPLPLWGWGVAGGGVVLVLATRGRGNPAAVPPAPVIGAPESGGSSSQGGGTSDPGAVQSFDLAALAAALGTDGKNVNVTTPGGATITTSPAPEPVQSPGDVNAILAQMMANLRGIVGTIGITLPGGASFNETTSGPLDSTPTKPPDPGPPLPVMPPVALPPAPPPAAPPLPTAIVPWLLPDIQAVWRPMSALYKAHRVTVQPGKIGANWDLANLPDITASTGLASGTHLALPVGYDPSQDQGGYGLAGTGGESGWHKFTRLWDDTMLANPGANPQAAATYALAVLKLETNGAGGTGFAYGPVAAARVGETFAQYLARLGADTSGHALHTGG